MTCRVERNDPQKESGQVTGTGSYSEPEIFLSEVISTVDIDSGCITGNPETEWQQKSWLKRTDIPTVRDGK